MKKVVDNQQIFGILHLRRLGIPAMKTQIEREICQTAIEGLLAAGYSISVIRDDRIVVESSQDTTKIFDELLSNNVQGRLYVHAPAGYFAGHVSFIFGKTGWSTLAEYNLALRPALQKALEMSDNAFRQAGA
jgi:hypothetical protein